MSSLTVSVVLLAAIAIVVVAGYNLWLMRRRQPRGRGSEAHAREAVPVPSAAERAEPSLGLEPIAADPAATPDTGTAAPAAGAARGAPVLDPYTDCIVELLLPSPIGGERLVALTRGLRRAGSKPVSVEAAPQPDPTADRVDAMAADAADTVENGPDGAAPGAEAPAWRAPVVGGQYANVRVGVLLANRHGPLNAMEFSEFVAGVQGLADQLSVLADTPDMGSVLARARALDELCASLDAQVGIGVETRDPLGLEDLARLAAECGCAERGNNRYARLGPAGEVLFSLALADAPNRLSLLLDVPRAPAAQQPWQQMVACAQLCAQRLDGRLVDDAGRPLPEAHLARIEQQIVDRQRSLDDAGFPAGAPLTLRLFN